MDIQRMTGSTGTIDQSLLQPATREERVQEKKVENTASQTTTSVRVSLSTQGLEAAYEQKKIAPTTSSPQEQREAGATYSKKGAVEGASEYNGKRIETSA